MTRSYDTVKSLKMRVNECVAIAAALLATIAAYVYTHFKFDFSVPGYTPKNSASTIHRTELWLKFYDARLDAKVPYAKHALSLNENRKDFARVGWGTKGDAWEVDQHGNRRFEQVWFAGNHADIGGGYPENESRLSDITLQWMMECAAVIPEGLKVDQSVLNLWPNPGGMQHDEVKSGYGWLPNLLGLTWSRQDRTLPVPEGKVLSDSIIHRTAYKRFDLESVQTFDGVGPYRPEILRLHVDFENFYKLGAPFPAASENQRQGLLEVPSKHQNKRIRYEPRKNLSSHCCVTASAGSALKVEACGCPRSAFPER
jgi:hypothetical protein